MEISDLIRNICTSQDVPAISNEVNIQPPQGKQNFRAAPPKNGRENQGPSETQLPELAYLLELDYHECPRCNPGNQIPDLGDQLKSPSLVEPLARCPQPCPSTRETALTRRMGTMTSSLLCSLDVITIPEPPLQVSTTRTSCFVFLKSLSFPGWANLYIPSVSLHTLFSLPTFCPLLTLLTHSLHLDSSC